MEGLRYDLFEDRRCRCTAANFHIRFIDNDNNRDLRVINRSIADKRYKHLGLYVILALYLDRCTGLTGYTVTFDIGMTPGTDTLI
ncbi:hypothetical protein D3C85_1573350 [compost metagenome]